MAHFWQKLGLGRDKTKEVQLHEELEPTPILVTNEFFAQGDGRTPPTTELRDIPVVDIQQWNVAGIRSAVSAHVNGQFGNGALLTDAMLADDRIQGATNGRIKGVTKSNVRLEPSKKAKNQAKAKEVAKEIEDIWTELMPESIIEDTLKWQIFGGFCLLELIWEARGDKYLPRLKPWHTLYIYYRIDTRKYVAFTVDGAIEIEPNDPKWALYTPYGSYRGWMRGAVRSVSIPWVVRQFALRDWARYSEVHGLPQKKAKVPAQAPAEDKRRFFNSVKRLGSESAFLLPVPLGGNGADWDVELLEATDKSWQGFERLIERCDKSITLVIRGTNLTTEVSTGTGAATQAHREEDADYTEADTRKFSEFVRKQILMLYCLYNHGDADLAPTAIFENAPIEDKKQDASILTSVASAAKIFEKELGWKLKRKGLDAKFGLFLDGGKDVTTDEQPKEEENDDNPTA
jgi:phage gp29-like protein